MKVTIKYLNPSVARQFGQYNLEEVVVLPDTARYVDILNLLKEKYKAIHPRLDDKVLEETFVNEFLIFSDEGMVRYIKDNSIKVDKVNVGTIIAGG